MIWRLACLASIGWAGCGIATASPYWVAYEGNDFPENVGWTRYNFGDGSALRSIVNGVLILDSQASFQISDFYQVDRQVNPDPGETFLAEWRMRVLFNEGVGGSADAGVGIAPDQGGIFGLKYRVNSVLSVTEGWEEPIEPLVFHNYRLQSTDMINYLFTIDGADLRTGQWDLKSLNQSFFNFGDGVRGARSLTEWDFVRFGVVPEPTSLVGLGLVGAIWSLRRARS